jgi:type VI secretion system secreted protein Hcp
MPKLKTSALAVGLWLTISCSASLHAAVDMFLNFGTSIPGESRDSAHRNQVDVLAWNWGMANSGKITVRGGAGTNRFQRINVTKYVDKATPLLMQACAKGTHLSTVILYVRRAGTTPIEFIKMTLTEVLVTSVSSGGSGGEDLLTENISLTYAQLQIDYVPTRLDGTADKTVQFTWNLSNTGAAPLNPVTGLGTTLFYTNGSPQAKLTWASTSGASYQVWATTNLNSAFRTYGSPMPSDGNGTTALIVPADALQMYFRIQTLQSP